MKNYLDMSIEELHISLVNKEVTPSQLAKLSLERAHKLNPTLNPFVTINDDVLKFAESLDGKEAEGILWGIPYAIKDNFSTKGLLTTGSSKILSNYVPVFNATVVDKLNNANAVNIGKTVLDELALGGTGLNGHTGIVYNPWAKDLDRISGGSSAGSAVAVAAGIVPFAMGSDTGDSVRKPAALNGIIGFKPTYGRISRFGLFPFAASLDHVGFFTRNVKDAAYVLESVAGFDPLDAVTTTKPVGQYSKLLNGELKGKNVAIIDEIVNPINDERIRANIDDVCAMLVKNGANVVHKHMDEDLLKAILPVYMVISCAEATSNDANLDGIKFGPRAEGETFIDQMINTRTQGFSELVKRRFVIGSYALSRENQKVLLLRAQKVRRLIVNAVNEILKEADVILLPAAASIAAKIQGNTTEKMSEDYLIGENHLAIGNFGGYPSLTLPSGFIDEMPIAINLTGKLYDEQTVLDIAYGIENNMPYKNQIAKEVK